jgi:hypothetical protein
MWTEPGTAQSVSRGHFAFEHDGGVLWGVPPGEDATEIVRVNAAGKKLWSHTEDGVVVKAVGDAEGGAVLGGMSSDECPFGDQPGAFAQQAVVTRLGPKGEVLWRHMGPCYSVVTALRFSAPGFIAVTGAHHPKSFHDEDWHRTFVMLYTTTGEIVGNWSAEGQLFRACTCTLQLIVNDAVERGPTIELRALR